MQRNTEKSRTMQRNAEKCKDLVIYKKKMDGKGSNDKELK